MSVVNFEQHQCKKISSYLDSYLNNELLVETNHEVLKHLQICKDCAQALEDRARIKDLLQRAARRETAPDRLRERIQQDIRKPNMRKSSPVLFNAGARWAFAAAAMIAVVIGSWAAINSFSSRKHAPLEAAVEQSAKILTIGLEDHINCAIVHGLANRQFTPEQIAAKMGADYTGLVPVVKEKAPAGYDVVVAHKCYVNKREFVHLILKNQENVLSVVITKKNGEAFAPAAAIRLAADAPLYEARIQDYETAGFETRDYLGFIVSNLDKDDNLQIASSVAPAVRDFLVKMEA